MWMVTALPSPEKVKRSWSNGAIDGTGSLIANAHALLGNAHENAIEFPLEFSS
jgi:hypothetical protein